jgi:acyl-CoA reductase-like NAD-dependent aldehyde dehydrogenase
LSRRTAIDAAFKAPCGGLSGHGQICIAVNRIYLQEDSKRILQKFVEATKKLTIATAFRKTSIWGHVHEKRPGKG